METHTPLRTAVKAVSWRVFATCTTMAIAFVITGSMGTAFKVGIPDFVAKFLVFYAFERFWLLENMQTLKHRTLLKLLSWKALAVAISMAVTLYVTGSLAVSLKLGPIDTTLKTAMLYLHERMWEGVAWGKTIKSKPT